jgi:hypothetical protein
MAANPKGRVLADALPYDGRVPSALLLEGLTARGVGTAVRSDAGAHFLKDTRGYLLSEQAASGG